MPKCLELHVPLSLLYYHPRHVKHLTGRISSRLASKITLFAPIASKLMPVEIFSSEEKVIHISTALLSYYYYYFYIYF